MNAPQPPMNTPEKLATSSAATIARNLMTIPRLENGQPRHARGWHMLCWSDEVGVGQVIPRDYFGLRLAIYRGEDGKVRVVEAFCPHLGGDLSAGEVLGNNLKCPFHHWRYDGDNGRCVEIPYCDKIPPRAKTHAFPVLEINDTILIWFDHEYGEPEYDIPLAPEYNTEGWTPGWAKRELVIRTHPREVIENVVDKAHLAPIHGFTVEDWHPIWNRHICGELMWGEHTRLAADVEGDILYVRNMTYGPAYQYTWQVQKSGMFDSLLLTSWCPIDENNLRYWFGVTVRPNIAGITQEQAIEAAEGYAQASYDAFLEDVFIWERKLYRPEPVLCANDGPIAKLRRWHEQFYTDRAKVNNDQFADNGNDAITIDELRADPRKALRIA